MCEAAPESQRCPPSVQEEALIGRLLHRFIDMIDNNAKRLAITLNSKSCPELYDFQDEHAGYLWSVLQALENEHAVFSIRLAKNRARLDQPYEKARLSFNPACEALVRDWLGRARVAPSVAAWTAALVMARERFTGDISVLEHTPVVVAHKPAEQVLEAVIEMAQVLVRPVSLRELSALCFWGDSKFLQQREDWVRALYPQQAHYLTSRPLLVNLYLPLQLQQVLFVENHESFLRLSAQSPQHTALVYSAGFRAAAARIREPGQAVFSYLNLPPPLAVAEAFSRWWFAHSDAPQPVCYFWGDLDYSGMGILAKLNPLFGAVCAWRPGYDRMLEALQAGRGHVPALADKRKQVDPGTTGDAYADTQLLPAMRRLGCFLDQEYLASQTFTL